METKRPKAFHASMERPCSQGTAIVEEMHSQRRAGRKNLSEIVTAHRPRGARCLVDEEVGVRDVFCMHEACGMTLNMRGDLRIQSASRTAWKILKRLPGPGGTTGQRHLVRSESEYSLRRLALFPLRNSR